ncbi:restriction endonuclease [Pseudomonas japonica]|nr:restriction endonuclease [Pseudomonas japonica]
MTEQFQVSLWNTEAVSATGMGSVDISNVAKSQSVAEQLWMLKVSYAATGDPLEKESLISHAWNTLKPEVASLAKRMPKLKMYRLFALLCPGAFTTIAHFRKLRELATVMGISSKGEAGHRVHKRVLERLDEVLGRVDMPLSKEGATRLTLPWLLYVNHVQNAEAEATEISDPVTGKEVLNPLPPERRRRGMLAIRGGVSTIQAMIEFAVEGCTREDFLQHLQSVSPIAKKSTLATQLNALIAEWGALKAHGNELILTPRGEAFLESGDVDEVVDWMMTRILGFDNLLYALSGSSMANRDAILLLREVNPGWTKDFAPSSLIWWLRSLQLVGLTDKTLSLTERGARWVAQIHWEPKGLPAADRAGSPDAREPATAAESVSVDRPSVKNIIEGFDPEYQFPRALIAQLDAGLWSHTRRHFAVLTGLSGAGKTQLARGYALSMWQGEAVPGDGLLIVPVQPGWHDYSSLLGYVNPLDTDSYVRTGVLDFLLQASSDPSKPYILVLDEMNLSHPEQYLAPLLSAMETGESIELHGQTEDLNGVPNSIPYPDNLVIIGTVNMDETTHGLSDKVLDRATVIEFWDIDVNAFPGWDKSALAQAQVDAIRGLMGQLMDVLRPLRLHFGWRTLQDILGYVQQTQIGEIIEFEEALDHAVYSRILPKLRGEDSPRIQKMFSLLKATLKNQNLEHSLAKVEEMAEELSHTGSTRFWR